MLEILGFIKPDPTMIKNIDENNPAMPKGKPKQICPIIIRTAPINVAERVPVSRSATHPPKIEVI